MGECYHASPRVPHAVPCNKNISEHAAMTLRVAHACATSSCPTCLEATCICGNGKLLWKQIEANKSGNSHSLRSAAWNIVQFAKPLNTHGVDVCPRKNGQEWQLAWGLLSVIPYIGNSPNRGESLIVSLLGGLSNREGNSGGAPRATAKHELGAPRTS